MNWFFKWWFRLMILYFGNLAFAMARDMLSEVGLRHDPFGYVALLLIVAMEAGVLYFSFKK